MLGNLLDLLEFDKVPLLRIAVYQPNLKRSSMRAPLLGNLYPPKLRKMDAS